MSGTKISILPKTAAGSILATDIIPVARIQTDGFTTFGLSGTSFLHSLGNSGNGLSLVGNETFDSTSGNILNVNSLTATSPLQASSSNNTITFGLSYDNVTLVNTSSGLAVNPIYYSLSTINSQTVNLFYNSGTRTLSAAVNDLYLASWTNALTSSVKAVSSLSAIDSVPVGTVMYFAASSAPVGYFVCDGSSLDPTQYPDLFNVIKYTYGRDSYNTNLFKLPDLRGQFVRGWSAGAAVADANRQLGSNQAASIGSHKHDFRDVWCISPDRGAGIGSEYAASTVHYNSPITDAPGPQSYKGYNYSGYAVNLNLDGSVPGAYPHAPGARDVNGEQYLWGAYTGSTSFVDPLYRNAITDIAGDGGINDSGIWTINNRTADVKNLIADEPHPTNVALLPCIKYTQISQLNQVGLSAQTILNSVNQLMPLLVTKAPLWYVGQTNNLLQTESTINRTSLQISSSAAFTQYLQSVVASNTAVPVMPNSISITTSRVGAGLGEGQIMLGDGRIYSLGSYTYLPVIYDPLTDSVRTLTDDNEESSGGGCLLADGRVFISPAGPSSAGKAGRIYNPSTNTYQTCGGTHWSGLDATYNSTLLPNGMVYNNPSLAGDNAVIYDPVADTTTISNNTTIGLSRTCVTLRDGRVLRIPNGGTNVAQIYDYNTNNFTSTSSILTGSPANYGAWFGGRLTAEGKVVCPPNNQYANGAAVYDPSNNTWITTGVQNWVNVAASNVLNYGGGCLLPNGNLFFPIFSATGPCVVYNPYTNTTTPVSILPNTSTTGWTGATLCSNGNVFVAGISNNCILLRFQHVRNFDTNTLTSPYFNHGSY